MLMILLILILTALLSLIGFLIPLSPWFFFLWVPIALILAILLIILYHYVFILIQAKTKPNRRYKQFVLKRALKFGMLISNIKMKVYGKENLFNDRPYTIYGNHKSNWDVVFAYVSAKGFTTALGKKSLFQNKILKALGEGYQALPIARENDREAIKSILKAIKNINEYKLNYIIFPEGGVKSRETEEMVNLRAGAYKVAVKANVPIVPLCILGSSKLIKKKWYQHATIELHYLKPIMPEEFSGLNTTEIGHLVEQRINECVTEHEKI